MFSGIIASPFWRQRQKSYNRTRGGPGFGRGFCGGFYDGMPVNDEMVSEIIMMGLMPHTPTGESVPQLLRAPRGGSISKNNYPEHSELSWSEYRDRMS